MTTGMPCLHNPFVISRQSPFNHNSSNGVKTLFCRQLPTHITSNGFTTQLDAYAYKLVGEGTWRAAATELGKAIFSGNCKVLSSSQQPEMKKNCIYYIKKLNLFIPSTASSMMKCPKSRFFTNLSAG